MELHNYFLTFLPACRNFVTALEVILSIFCGSITWCASTIWNNKWNYSVATSDLSKLSDLFSNSESTLAEMLEKCKWISYN